MAVADLGTGHAPARSPNGFGRVLPTHLRRWVDASLITTDQADAIITFETGERPPTRRIPLVTEALGYLGLVLIGGALITFLAKLQPGNHVWEAVLAGLAIALLAGGWLLRTTTEPALVRLADVQWFLSTVAFGALIGVVVGTEGFGGADPMRYHGPAIWTAIGGASTLYALPLYAGRRHPAQLLALFLATMIAVPAFIALVLGPGDATPSYAAIGAWAVGVGWLAEGRLRIVAPVHAAIVLGSLAVAIAPIYVAPPGTHVPAALALGIASTAALMALSVLWRRTTLLWVGAAGLFVYVAWFIGQYLSDAIGLPLALLLGGVALLALAVVTARLRKSAT